MKLTSIFMLITVLHVSASSVSQTVTFSGREVSLKKVFDVVKKQTGYLVFYNKDLLETAKPVTVNARNMPLTAFLEAALKDQRIDYLIENQTIFIRKKTSPGFNVNTNGKPDENPLPPVTGVVYGADGMPLEGVNIVVKGVGTGVVSDENGRFSIDVPANAILVFSYIGFADKEIAVGNQATLTVSMEEEESALSGVVVVGYGTQRKASLTTAVGSVTGKAIAERGTVNPMKGAQG
ncbi:MAG TPA: carboxypeptidase-like regulatory domain-containing protein, partial [Flavitalea sp.]|nr:carboxypeptidase-like regulatory domain-containing protein [Flavitalea sp.]